MQTNGLKRERLWRFWNEETQHMIYDEYGLDSEGYPYEYTCGDNGEYFTQNYQNISGLITMDYINQHDIKGEKIFEGDILFKKTRVGVYIGVVEWIANEYSSEYGIRWVVGNASYRWNELEIIGHIHENIPIRKLYDESWNKQLANEERKKEIGEEAQKKLEARAEAKSLLACACGEAKPVEARGEAHAKEC